MTITLLAGETSVLGMMKLTDLSVSLLLLWTRTGGTDFTGETNCTIRIRLISIMITKSSMRMMISTESRVEFMILPIP